eukprot:11287529-Ditylum_brightwellii.AAC.1
MFFKAECVKVLQVQGLLEGLQWTHNGLCVGSYGFWYTCMDCNTRFEPWTISALLWDREE